MNIIKIGSEITYRGCWGSDPPKRVKVESLTVTEYPREKYGKNVTEVNMSMVRSNRVLFGLSDGHWCYSEQVVL